MTEHREGDLEARVVRLERQLNRVLDLLEAGSGDPETQNGTEGVVAEPPEVSGVGMGGGPPPGEDPAPPKAAEQEPQDPASPMKGPGPSRETESSIPGGHSTPAEDPSPASPPKGPPSQESAGQQSWKLLEDLGIYPLRGAFLARLGIALLLLSVAYFFKYSIDQGWLIPAIRLGLGVAAGLALVGLGFKGASNGTPLGTALAGGGIATFFITGYTGHQWYSLVSYPVAFGFLFAASALGIFLSLRSGLQALAIVGLIGALATPLLLAPETTEVSGLALYVSLIVASVAAVYMVRAWRALFLLAVVIAWLVLSAAVGQAVGSSGMTLWVVQGGITFCALVFWLVPLLRAILRDGDPGRWVRPESAYRETAGLHFVPWNAHLDALSLLMPVVGIWYSAWLWGLSQPFLGWVFLGWALLAQAVGWWLSRSRDPEDSASTQRFVSIILSTVGLGLVLTGDVLYLAFIAEAAALLAVGARKESRVLLGLGALVEVVVIGLFLGRLVLGGTLLEGNLSSLLDLAALGGAVFIGVEMRKSEREAGFFIGAYLGLLALTARELQSYFSLLYLAFLGEAVATHVWAARREDRLLEGLGLTALGLVFFFFILGTLGAGGNLGGDFIVLVDIAALAGTAYIGTLVSNAEVRRGLFAAAYIGLLVLLGRELMDHPAWLYLAFLLTVVATQVTSARMKNSDFQALGHIPALICFSLFVQGLEEGGSLLAGDLIPLLDLLALAGAAYVGTLLDGRQGRGLYLMGAYVGLFFWTGREFYPLEQGQALMSFAFGLQGTAVLVAGFLMDRPFLQKLGVGTLLLVVGKVMLVDMAAVEPVWRVLLLFLFGGLFLLLSRFVQGRRQEGEEEPSPLNSDR